MKTAQNEMKVIAETERLIIRKFQNSDLNDLYEILSDPETVKYEPYSPMSMQEVKESLLLRVESEEFVAVECKADSKVIGNIYLGKRDCESLELGYVFNRRYWSKGYATESGAKLTERLFESGIHRIYAECDPKNTASWELLERLGFRREAFLRQNVYFKKDESGKPLWKDTYIYAKLNEEN